MHGNTMRPGEPLVQSPLRVLSGFGMAVRSASRFAAPRTVEELQATVAQAAREGMPVAFRGAGNSYGDASLTDRGLAIDTTGMDRILKWDPATGIAEVEPGATIADLWARTIQDGWWPAVVPGTMAATLAGCAAMNIHGKNCYKVGPFGDQVQDFDLLTPEGRLLTCSRDQNPDVFHAAIGGFGMLGAFTRVRLKLKHVDSGILRVESIRNKNLDHAFDIFDQRLEGKTAEQQPDYLVGWFDGFPIGQGFGRGVIHAADYVPTHEDRRGPAVTLRKEFQDLPGRILGVPRGLLWRFLKPLNSDFPMSLLNAGKYWASFDRTYTQSHAAFAFLLDYLPDWRNAYLPQGFIQYQPFVPRSEARRVFRAILELAQTAGLFPYLMVFKRHRPDPFWLTHAVDGYSLAMDFKVWDRARLWELCHRMSDVVLDAGGRFYFAKDAVLRPGDALRMFGQEAIDRFAALRKKLDPQGLLRTDLSERVFGAALR